MPSPRGIWLVLVLTAAYACTGYSMIADPTTALRGTPNPNSSVRVTLRDGEVLRLEEPQVVRDSLFGQSQADSAVGIALNDVAGVERRAPRGWQTVMLVIGAIGVAFFALAVWSNAVHT